MSDAGPGITVGLVGTGRMGSAMAHAIARAGLPLVVNNRSPERAQALADELGARVVASPADVAAAADVTLTMLADDAAVADGLRRRPTACSRAPGRAPCSST